MGKRTYLISVDPEENRFRYYQIIMQVDMFGAMVQTTWGRLGEKPKGGRTRKCRDKKEAKEYRERLIKARMKKNYMRVV